MSIETKITPSSTKGFSGSIRDNHYQQLKTNSLRACLFCCVECNMVDFPPHRLEKQRRRGEHDLNFFYSYFSNYNQIFPRQF